MFQTRPISSIATLLLPALLAACATSPSNSSAVVAHADIINASGQPAGSAVVKQSGSGLVMELALSGITTGVHGIHFHTTGLCDGPAFTTAGAHLNPHAKMHGSENPQGPHLGDLPNITAGPDGRANVTVQLNSGANDLAANLFDADGTAIVVHASADDYRTDPSGNSGSRIACGVIQRG